VQAAGNSAPNLRFGNGGIILGAFGPGPPPPPVRPPPAPRSTEAPPPRLAACIQSTAGRAPLANSSPTRAGGGKGAQTSVLPGRHLTT